MKKTGFIAIVGRPNVGKSTLLNSILGEKVAIVSNKPQTTRNRIIGIHTEGDNQFVFLDTPGIHSPKNKLGDFMVSAANNSMRDSDAVILVVEAGKPVTQVEENVISYIKSTECPSVVAINKTDLSDANTVAETIKTYAALHDFDAFVPMSAKKGNGTKAVLDECEKFLMETDAFFFDTDIATDQPERQLASEIIREKILKTLNKEVPHGVAVVIEDWKESGKLVSIRAEIFCEKASHKGIIVGKNGDTLKHIGTYARQDLERILGTKVFLDLWVKVKQNWRDSVAAIGNFGYNSSDN